MSLTTARGATHAIAREPKSWSSAASVAAMTTEAPIRRLDDLWDDGEFVLSRVRRNKDRPAALFVRPAAAHLAPATTARLEHAHSLCDDLDS